MIGFLTGLWIAAIFVFVIQVADAVFAVLDALTTRDSDELDAVKRRRFRELSWALAITASVAVLIAFGVDSAARLLWDAGDPAAGTWLLLLCAASAFVVGMTGVVSVLRSERPTYARIRRDLRDRSTLTIDRQELAEFEDRLDRADRLAARRPRAALVLRLIGGVFVVAVAVILTSGLSSEGNGLAWGTGLGGVVALVASVVAIRAAAVRQSRLSAVHAAQRAEVVALLERARIPQRGRVPGLRDRVARALAILREKQR